MQQLTQTTLIVIAIGMLVFGCYPPQPQPNPTTHKGTLPFDWPVDSLTREQILVVRQCDIENILQKRYPDSILEKDLLNTYRPQTDCDWAILAVAYANRRNEGEPLSQSAQQAFTHAVINNSGFALATPIFYEYFDAMAIVKPPVFAQQEITDVRIKYNWLGLGNVVEYSVNIRQANTEPIVTSTYSDSLVIDKPTVQALATALTDFLPVSSKFNLQPCTDNYPVWSVGLTFTDKKHIDVTTESNFMYIGGPWFTKIDRQVYVQFSSAFGQAVGKLIESLGLPFGEAAGMFCSSDTVFDKAFP